MNPTIKTSIYLLRGFAIAFLFYVPLKAQRVPEHAKKSSSQPKNVIADSKTSFAYCTPDWLYGANDITQFDFGTFSNNTGLTGQEYEDLTSTVISTIMPGNTISWSIQNNLGYTSNSIWIDYDDDELFETSEQIVSSVYTSTHSKSGTVTISASAAPGQHRMRVLVNYYYNNTQTASNPCPTGNQTYAYGQAEDYTVEIGLIAHAGPDISICSGTNAYMNAFLPLNATGAWTLVSGTGNIVSPTSATSQVTSVTGSVNIFLWTITLGNQTSQDTVYIRKAVVPTNVIINSFTTNSATFSWTAATDPDSFHIRVQQNCTTTGGLNFRVPGNLRTYTINNLSGCTNYCIRVRSQCLNQVYTSWSTMSAPFTTSGPVTCGAVNNLVITPVQGCEHTLDWSTGCASADSFRIRYRVNNGNWQITIPGTTSTSKNLTLGQGNWDFRIQTWCSGQNVATSTNFTYSIGSCVIPYNASASQNANCNYRIQWETCAPSDSFKVRYREGNNPFSSSSFTTANFKNINLGIGNWEYKIQSWCGNALMGTTPSYFISIPTCRLAGVAEEVVSRLELFPNPATNRSLLNFSSEIDGAYILTISDLSGRVMKRIQGNAVAGENTIEILVDEYAKGIYFVGLTLNEESRQIKLIVQ